METMNMEAMMREIARLKEENDKLKQTKEKKEKKIWYKVSPKGCVSIMGIRRMPITLYKDEINMILADLANLNSFMKDNKDTLVTRVNDDAE
jgi:hypothetical protein